jgi:RNA polymerase sigma factor (sigma-70 family)
MNNRQELAALVSQARAGELEAFDALVRRFQDIAAGYAYSLLGDSGGAQDAAQEAFIQLYRDLPKLRAPEAFLSWFRQIIFKQCDRIRRRQRFDLVPLDSVAQTTSGLGVPARAPEEHAAAVAVRLALDALPDLERAAIVLFYYQDASLKDIAEFLGISQSIVDHRLRSARKHLSERMLDMAQRDWQANRPSNDTHFVLEVMDGLTRLSNPHGLEARLQEEIEFSRSTQQGFGLVLFDIDTFRPFNQQWGHAAGDCLLAALARRTQDMLEAGDFVARYAGDEFALVIRRPSAQAVSVVANAVREAIAADAFSLAQLLQPEARYPAGEVLWPPSAANDEFRRGLGRLRAGELGPAAEAFRSALARDAQHVPSIMELEYLELRTTSEAARLNETFRLTLSGGASVYHDGDTPQSLIERADGYLGRAKQAGRNQILLAPDQRQE